MQPELKAFIDAVERLAFDMKPPNPYTPQFVQLCVEARTRLMRPEVEEHLTAEQAVRRIDELHEEIKRMAWIRDGRPQVIREPQPCAEKK